MKIKEGDLDSALANGRSEGCFIARWCDKSCNPRASVAVQQGSPPVSDTGWSQFVKPELTTSQWLHKL